jgi:hypothetical protein
MKYKANEFGVALHHEKRRQLESIRRGFAEIEAGHYIPHGAVKAWLLSRSSDHELPPPKCVCGDTHDRPKGGTC